MNINILQHLFQTECGERNDESRIVGGSITGIDCNFNIYCDIKLKMQETLNLINFKFSCGFEIG